MFTLEDFILAVVCCIFIMTFIYLFGAFCDRGER